MWLDVLNQNSGVVSVVFSGVVASATVVYAILTWKLVSETRRMREAQTEPRVSVTLQPRQESINLIDMVIQNIGLGPAYDMRFEVSPDFECLKGRFLSEMGWVTEGLEYLAPRDKLQFFLTSMTDDFQEKVGTTFEVSVTYHNRLGNTYEDVYSIGFSQWAGLLQLGEPPIQRIAKNMEEIKRELRGLSTTASSAMSYLREERTEAADPRRDD